MELPLKYPCPVCGYLVFLEPSGSYDICPICDWEDDMVQLRHPDMGGGANKVSLIEAQQNFLKFGASEEAVKSRVRTPLPTDERDPKWRPWDPTKDSVSVEKLQTGTDYFHEALKDSPVYYWLK